MGAGRQQGISLGAVSNMGSAALWQYEGFSTSLNITNGAASALSITLNGPGSSYNLGSTATDSQHIADAINHAGVPGLSAVANGTSLAFFGTQTSAGSTSGTGVLTLNGVAINLSYVSGGTPQAKQQNLSNALTAINAQSAATGVTAVAFNGSLNFFTFNGTNIVASYGAGTATGSAASDFAMATGVSQTAVTLNYQAPLGAAITSVTASGAGLGTVTTNVLPSGNAMNSVDLTTTAGATAALGVLDAALSTVSATRANLGAGQNRLQSAIANLQATSTNMGAARSRIQDADFAQETANLSRAQILQNAGTAMVAQANQQPQGVLALLR